MSHIFRYFWHQKSFGFHRIFPLLMQHFVRFSTFFGPTAPRILGFFTGFSTCLGLLHQTCWVFTGFSSSDAFTGFSSSDAKFPTCTYKHTTMVPAESVIMLQIFWPKTIWVCKAIFYIFKNKSARIYLCKAIFYIFGNDSPKQRFMYVIILAGMVHNITQHNIYVPTSA